MFTRIISLTVLIALLAPLIPFSRTRATGPSVVINELMWMGSSASASDEWIELRNMGETAIDISNWELTKKSNGAEVPMLTIPAGKTIDPQGFFLISNYADTSASSAFGIAPDLVETDVALSNSALQIKLYDAARVLVDTADDGSGNPVSGLYDSGGKIYAAMERNNVPGDGTQGENWHTASRGVGAKEGKTEFGTPRSRNSNARPTAQAGADQKVTVGTPVNFDGSDSSDPEGATLSYAWDFGDGGTAGVPTPQHTYTAPGTMTVTLTVSDGVDTSQDQLTVTVAAAAEQPAAEAAPIPTVNKDVATKVPAAALTSCRGVRLSELLPNPKGSDDTEFLELENTVAAPISLGGCKLWIGTTRVMTLKSETVVAPHQWLSLPKAVTRLALTNGGATVRLVDSDGTELDRVEYPESIEGQSWSRLGDSWGWTDRTTPGAANAEPSPAAMKKTEVAAKEKKVVAAVAKPVQRVTIAAVQELDSGDRVQVTGTVTAPLDVLGKGYAYLQDESGGIAISLGSAPRKVLLDQRVTITGTVRIKEGRRSISVGTKDEVAVAGGEAREPQTLTTGGVDENTADELVRVSGVVSLVSGARIDIDDGSGTVSVSIKSSTGIVRPSVKMGDKVDATGIVSATTSGIKILPRFKEDVRIEKVLGAAATTNTTVVPPSSSKQSYWYWMLVALGGLAAAAKPAWGWWKGRKNDATV